jgi:hypothetical protein
LSNNDIAPRQRRKIIFMDLSSKLEIAQITERIIVALIQRPTSFVDARDVEEVFRKVYKTVCDCVNKDESV